MIDKIMIWPAILKTEWSTLIGSFTVNITQCAFGYLHRSRLQGQEPDRTKRKNFGISRCCSGDNFLNTFSLAVLLIESQALVLTVLFLPYPPPHPPFFPPSRFTNLGKTRILSFAKQKIGYCDNFNPVYVPFYFTVWFATERRSVTSYFYSSKISGSQFLENYGLLFCSWVQSCTTESYMAFFFQSYLQDHGSGNFSTFVTLQSYVTTSLYILKYLWLHSLLGLSLAHLDFEAVVKNTQLPQDPTFCEIQSACQENGFVTVLFRGNCHVIYWWQRWEPQGMMLQRLSLEEPLWLAARTTGSVSSCCDQYSRPFLCQGAGCQILEELRPSAHQG